MKKKPKTHRQKLEEHYWKAIRIEVQEKLDAGQTPLEIKNESEYASSDFTWDCYDVALELRANQKGAK